MAHPIRPVCAVGVTSAMGYPHSHSHYERVAPGRFQAVEMGITLVHDQQDISIWLHTISEPQSSRAWAPSTTDSSARRFTLARRAFGSGRSSIPRSRARRRRLPGHRPTLSHPAARRHYGAYTMVPWRAVILLDRDTVRPLQAPLARAPTGTPRRLLCRVYPVCQTPGEKLVRGPPLLVTESAPGPGRQISLLPRPRSRHPEPERTPTHAHSAHYRQASTDEAPRDAQGSR